MSDVDFLWTYEPVHNLRTFKAVSVRAKDVQNEKFGFSYPGWFVQHHFMSLHPEFTYMQVPSSELPKTQAE